MDGTELWGTFGEHLARLYGSAPRVYARREEAWFCVLTYESHTDVNIGVLTAIAQRADADELLALIEEADVAAVVAVSAAAAATLADPLLAAGLEAAPLTEALMWCPVRPPPTRAGFRVERVRGQSDLEDAIEVSAEGHAMDASVAARVFSRSVSDEEPVGTWLAYDGDEPVSVVWLTLGSRIGIWQMMTPPRHRRRGAARAVLTCALAEVWQPSTVGAFLWATPAGRPLYDTLGFQAIDEATVWVSDGTEAGNLAIGKPAA